MFEKIARNYLLGLCVSTTFVRVRLTEREFVSDYFSFKSDEEEIAHYVCKIETKSVFIQAKIL